MTYAPAPLDYSTDGGKPQVITWFQVYAGVMAGVYGLILLGSLVGAGALLTGHWAPAGDEAVDAYVMVGCYGGMGLPLTIAHLLPFFVRPKRWVWIYNLVLICLGMTSACCLPASIPLLIFWIKDPVKRWYGM